MFASFKAYFSDISYKGNLYFVALRRLFIIMLIFSLCRLLFLLFNLDFYPHLTTGGVLKMFLGGLRFDTTAVLYTNLLYITCYLIPFQFRYNEGYQKVLKYLFFVTNGIAIGANCADFAYFRFTLRRTTATVFSEFKNEENFGSLIPQFIADYWYIVLIWLALIAVVVLFYGKIRKPIIRKNFNDQLVYFLNGLVLMLISVTLIVGGLRGGFRHSTRPITLSNAGQYVKEPLEIAIVLNTPFAIYKTLEIESFKRINYFSDDDLEKIYSPVHHPVVADTMKRDNVVIFILESFGREYIESYNKHLLAEGYQGFTPFLDSIIGNGLFFKYSFANGRKSIDAMPSIIASIPMMVEPYITTSYSGNEINSIASILGEEGYHTSFFHGAPNGSMGFQAFSNVAGFREYYGMNEYPHSGGFDGMWGIWDEEFFQFFADKLNDFPQPFCTAIFSVSSHHPFKVPKRYEGVFSEGTLPIHKCIAYTDYSLRLFFEKVSAMPWFPNTLFVFTADHANQSFYPEYKTLAGGFSVPVVFYKPDGSLQCEVNDLAQQIDIMPTILGYLGYSKPFLAFGQNLFDESQSRIVMNYSNGAYNLFQNDYLLIFNGSETIGLYNFKTDKILSNNLLGTMPEVEQNMVLKIKAIIQQYNNRMIDNKLTLN